MDINERDFEARRDALIWRPSALYPVKLIQAGWQFYGNEKVPQYDTWSMRGRKPLLVRRA